MSGTRRAPYQTASEPPALATMERKLWLAVLEVALDDVRLAVRTRTVRAEKAERDREWFASGSREVRAFLWVCDVLGFDPDPIRRYVARGCPLPRRPSVASGGES